MVVADFNILCLLEESEELFTDMMLNVSSFNMNVSDTEVIYYDSWKVIQSLKGVYYNIEPIDRIRDDYEYENEFFDLLVDKENKNDKYYVNLIKAPYIVKVNRPYKESIINIIDYYIEKSPVNIICVLFRIQGKEEEQVVGIVKRDDFIPMLLNGEIRFNVQYFVGKE